MAFNVSELSEYVQNNSKEIATAAVANAQTASLLISNKQVQAGVKGSAAILKMDSDVNFQDGSSCGRTAVGTLNLFDKKITVTPIKDNQNICPKSLWNTYFAEMVQKGQAPEESFTPEFAKSIMDHRAKKIAAEIEKLLWSGDTSLTGTTNMKRIDGLKKHIGSGNAVSATGSTLINKLQHVYLQVPVEIRSQEDFRFFIGEDKAAEYAVALANANLYRAGDDLTVYGTPIKIVPTAGLNGSGKVYASRISNFHLGLDGESDADQASLRYSIETDQWYMDFAFAVGVAVMTAGDVTVASI